MWIKYESREINVKLSYKKCRKCHTKILKKEFTMCMIYSYNKLHMKTVQVKSFGSNDVIEVAEINKPEPQADQVQVEIHAASINPFDIKTLRGQTIPMDFPYTPGSDFSGIVSSLGEEVSEFKVGDEVFGSASVLSKGSGAFAEFAVARITSIAPKPQKMNFVEAASLPLVGSSAIQALEDYMKLQNGQKILIHGGAGGIGSIAIQLAKYIGAYVATTVSGEDIEFAKSLGADQVIDYKTQKFEEMLTDFDAVFDTVGGDTTNKSFLVLKKNGILVSMLSQPNEELAQKYEVTAIGQGTRTNTERLTQLAELVDNGAIKPQVDRVFPLYQVKEAIDYMENDSPRGKVVLTINE